MELPFNPLSVRLIKIHLKFSQMKTLNLKFSPSLATTHLFDANKEQKTQSDLVVCAVATVTPHALY